MRLDAFRRRLVAYDLAMTVPLGPPYIEDAREKLPSPPWHRLRSALWLAANVVLTSTSALLLVSDVISVWALIVGLVAILVAAGGFVASIRDAIRFARPVLPLSNLTASVLINPYMLAGYLVGLGILDFG